MFLLRFLALLLVVQVVRCKHVNHGKIKSTSALHPNKRYKREEVPFLISVVERRHDGTNFMICGAVLLNENHAITAASCVHNKPPECINVFFYVTKSYKLVNEIIIHEEYKSNGSLYTEHDIAILRLQKKHKLRRYTNIFSLPQAFNKTVNAGKIFLVTRVSSRLSHNALLIYSVADIITNTDCQQKLKNEDENAVLYTSQFCVRCRDNYSYIGRGLIQKFGSNNVLIGLSTRNNIFTNISLYRVWIESKIRKRAVLKEIIHVPAVPYDFAKSQQFPFHVAVVQFTNNTATDVRCSGALIKENYVLAPAFCKTRDLKNYRVALGVVDFPSQKYSKHVAINQFIIHELYNLNKSSHVYDIAIVELNETVVLNKFVNLVYLPESSNYFDESMEMTVIRYMNNPFGSQIWKLVFYPTHFVNKSSMKTPKLHKSLFRIKKDHPTLISRVSNKSVLQTSSNKLVVQSKGNRSFLIGLSTKKRRIIADIYSHVSWIKNKIKGSVEITDPNKITEAYNWTVKRKIYPLIVGIFKFSGNSSFEFLCAGVLIGDWDVVTSASCVSDEEANYKIRVTGASNDSLLHSERDITARKIFIHEQYKNNSLVEHDIAVIRLGQNVTSNLNFTQDFLSFVRANVTTDTHVLTSYLSNGQLDYPLNATNDKIIPNCNSSEQMLKKYYQNTVQNESQFCTTGYNNTNYPSEIYSALIFRDECSEDASHCRAVLLGLPTKNQGIFTWVPFYTQWILSKIQMKEY